MKNINFYVEKQRPGFTLPIHFKALFLSVIFYSALFLFNPSSFASVSSDSTSGSVPRGPIRLKANAISSTQINLSWVELSKNELGFLIERKTSKDSSGSWELLDSVGSNVTKYQDLGLKANTSYSYRVRAFNLSGKSKYSNIASAVTFADSTSDSLRLNNSELLRRSNILSDTTIDSTGYSIPNSPSRLKALVLSSSEIRLLWKDMSSNEQGFLIERKVNIDSTGGDSVRVDSSNAWEIIGSVKSNTRTFKDSGLKSNTSYSYRVSAFNQSGQSGYSNIASATTFQDSTFDSTSSSRVSSVGIETKLEGNYPQPFNPTTKINFTLGNNGLVKLTVYDITGKIVKELVNEFMNAGYHTIEFNGSNLASGVYFYRLETAGITDIKKMMLIK